ncbi:MAG: Sporulation kinase A [Syntrophorhabdus sp. PtaB.Bin006]|nr:MAG: Sporulation kinase A [Syntrophorhabdus sp. PtaB.Bin006]
MRQPDEPKEDVFRELSALRERIAALEKRETELRLAEEALIKKEKFFRSLFNATEDIAFLMETDGTVALANDKARKFYGIPHRPPTGAPVSIYELIPAERVAGAKRRVRSVVETGKALRFEGLHAGNVFENSLYPVFGEDGDVQRIAVYARDITERKKMEASLQKAEEKYRNIYENATEGNFQISPEGRFLSANPALARIHGYVSPQELAQSVINVPRQLYVDPRDHDRLMGLLRTEGAVQNFEVRMYRKDRSLHWISVNVRVVRASNGKPLYYEGTMQDITKRKEAEEALSESEERYRVSIEHSNDAVAIIRGDTTEYVNRRFIDIFGYESRNEVIGASIFIVVHPDDRDRVIAINRMRQEGKPVSSSYEFKGIRKDGTELYVEVSAATIVYRGTPVYLVYLRDITERKQAEEALRNERNRFQALSDNAPFGIIVINQDNVFTYLNPKFEELFQYDLTDIPNGREWFKKAFPDIRYREEVISAWAVDVKNTKRGERAHRTFTITCKNGTKKTVNFVPVRLATGEYLISLDDITERIQAQEALMKSHRELEKLNRAKSKAVNHISHELKTPLAVIRGNILILKRKLTGSPIAGGIQGILVSLERNLERLFGISKETDEIFRVTQEVEANVLLDDLERLWERIEDLSALPPDMQVHLEALKGWVNQYRAGAALTFQSIDLFPFVLQVLSRTRQSAGHRKIGFETEGQNDFFVFMDPVILREIVEGLLKNAIENTPDGGKIRITVEQKGERIWLHVTDYGIGIPEEDQQYLFDGLFHTKETDLYASRKPYDFGAGGKGLELLRMRVYGQRFGFDITMKSRRCIYIPGDKDLCPGNTSICPHIRSREECIASGGTTFSVSFAIENKKRTILPDRRSTSPNGGMVGETGTNK